MATGTGGPAAPGAAPRVRRTDAQTERAVLDAAMRLVDDGLTVSLEHVSFERVVLAAGVSRASAYRRWPHKDLFLADLLREVASSTGLADDDSLLAGALAELAARADELREPAGRRDLLLDLLRRVLDADQRLLAGSPRWRTYVAVRATVAGLPDGALRREVAAQLRTTEDAFLRRRTDVFAGLIDLLGYRTVPGLTREDALLAMSAAIGAMSTGMVVRAFSADPAGPRDEVEAAPWGTAMARPWSVPALATTAVILGFVEPDPSVTWDDERVGAVRVAVAGGTAARTEGSSQVAPC